ncbi:hypothetical protein UA08_06758 [Talaromyces atroroseus]|uniref:N-acetyltransferase domain-containing protein n=1 Tax=Talaromyces atroroseus TaxID=1441469 RepID=A0A225AUC5_TALAT|nr:hypothetical protein UA08_06758 [Talaromyces atroroseus]OKL58015.1 hypothetical protein UA08_06758 [Talaromyces atroroseus]
MVMYFFHKPSRLLVDIERARFPARYPSKSSTCDLGYGPTSYLVQRSLRVKKAEERILALASTGGSRRIKPEVALILRHATHMDAEELMNLYNSYVRGTVQCLDTKPIAVDDMFQRVDESRKEELPFIVAIDVQRQESGRKMLEYIRLTKFLDGQPSVSGTARLEIMIWHSNRGQNVGRCLMDAMMTLADPRYSPKGGYYFMPPPNDMDDISFSSSISCRPLSYLVMLMNHSDPEASRFRRIRDWLSREHTFSQKGDLPSVAEKMGQPVNIAILVRRIRL